MEGQLALGALHTRFPAMRLAVDPARLHWGHGDGLVLRGLSALPVHLGPSDQPAVAADGSSRSAGAVG